MRREVPETCLRFMTDALLKSARWGDDKFFPRGPRDPSAGHLECGPLSPRSLASVEEDSSLGPGPKWEEPPLARKVGTMSALTMACAM
ncbi:hypothetical protein CDAR_546501 [Caerostris darwini]|uniref:Uncharacterized protein n=1 Tax=Caerostris darwini TaxID=1538125 RepID=A0AAV4M492_9ARAC|nr:hypothetical protein CDAR_546501 [Caerostris darwini]